MSEVVRFGVHFFRDSMVGVCSGLDGRGNALRVCDVLAVGSKSQMSMRLLVELPAFAQKGYLCTTMPQFSQNDFKSLWISLYGRLQCMCT